MAKHQYEVELQPQPDNHDPLRHFRADGVELDSGDGFFHFHADGERTHSFARAHVVRIERKAPAEQ